MSIIKCKNVSKFYHNKNNITSALSNISVEFDMGEFVVITGESGSGKTTLLNVISGLDSYEDGELYINGEETSHYTESDYELYRRKYIANIFQKFNLINSYTVYQNVELALLFNGANKRDVKSKVLNILKTVGMSSYRNQKVSKLSGGQKQRVAIARALAKDSPVIVADEPTGNLDLKSAEEIMRLLHEISRDKLVIIVTHNYEQVSNYATRKINMHDGKIIEDKIITKKSNSDFKPMELKNITFKNRLLLGLRNVFNIKSKFLLLFIVYLFLTMAVFSEYSSIRKIKFDSVDLGITNFFQNVDSNRVVVNKNDRSAFSEDELNKIATSDNVKTIYRDDLFLDYVFTLQDQDVNFMGSIEDANNIDAVDIGSLPSNDDEIVIRVNKYDYYLETYGEKLVGKKMELFDNEGNSNIPKKLTISGISIDESEDLMSQLSDNVTIYVKSSILNTLKKSSLGSLSKISLSFNGYRFDNRNGNLYFYLKASSKLKSGEAVTFKEMNNYCYDYDCTDQKVDLNIENAYYSDATTLKVKSVLSKENFKNYTDETIFDEYASAIYISQDDYDDLFVRDTYQISVFLDDVKAADETIEKLSSNGYDTYYVRNMLANPFGDMMGVIELIRSFMFIISAVILFFISYFIIKIVLKSRNIYFSTIRILGSTKRQASSLLRIELLTDINIAYIAFLALVLLSRLGVISIDYIKDVITYFKFIDYVIVYIILVGMSLLISNRYSKKLFDDSVMKTYREEV